MSTTRILVRSNQWWDHKVPPVIAIAAIAIGGGDNSPASADLVDLLILTFSVIGIAAFGHLLNDWSDVEADAKGGKHNSLSELTNLRRALLVTVALSAGLVPWLWLPDRNSARVALGVEIALLIAYSVQPVRLKARGWLGALADALYAYAVPFVIVLLLLAPERWTSPLPTALLCGWGLLGGLRGILWHQVEDIEADRAAGVETFAARVGSNGIQAFVANVVLPLEAAAGLTLVVLSPVGWLPWVVGAFMLWRVFQVTLLWMPPLQLRSLGSHVERVEIVGFAFLNEFLERWLPTAALVALAVESPWWWIVVVVYLVVFRSAVRSFLAHDVWLIPDAAQRLAVSWGIRREIREVAERRRKQVARGAPQLDASCNGRFVFVVCGPESHLLTLRTAIQHLRPLTRAEIWVITDSRRNDHPIVVDGIDHLADVETPSHLDNHQASIWLKTSLHRHLPPGEWCYLDSDIIAIAPGCEEVFAERQGVVAFASDVTIRENSVDRFSPWAMTCSCLGHGDEHSCEHLREQLHARFELEVPGDWLHWNGGVFLFGPESTEFLDMWHERAVASFDWPEWKTRDQGALISTVWSLGLQDLPRISPAFNFIADLGNGDLCLDKDRGWAHHPSGPWFNPKFLHLYTSPLEDPGWDLGKDVESVVLRRSRVRVYRWQRGELAARLKQEVGSRRDRWSFEIANWAENKVFDWRLRFADWSFHWWNEVLRLAHWAKCWFDPRRLSPSRIAAGIRRRRGEDVPAALGSEAGDIEPVHSGTAPSESGKN